MRELKPSRRAEVAAHAMIRAASATQRALEQVSVGGPSPLLRSRTTLTGILIDSLESDLARKS